MDGRFRYNRIVDDNDGIYLHQAGGRSIHLQRVTVANVRDDGVDTWNAKAHFEDMIVRDIVDKGFSISTGQVAIEHSLIANVRIGVETKIDTNDSPQTTINRTTIANAGFGVRAKGNSSEIQNLVTNSVIDVEADGDAIWVDGDDNRTVVRHSLIGEEWMFGEQNRVGAANFVSVTDNDFRLQVGSLAVNAGDPNAVPDEDGSTLDAGYYSLLHSLRGHRFQAVDIDRTCAAILANEQKAQVDFNSDGVVDLLDHHYLINQVMRITAGDANVDGVFDSKDLVLVFQPGEYEDETDGNSQWSEGDWNCDGDFDTKDLVAAFQAGGYQRASHPSRLTTPAGAIDQLFGQSDDNDSKVRARQK